MMASATHAQLGRSCCPASAGHAALHAAARCFHGQLSPHADICEHNESVARNSLAAGAECMASTAIETRGFFVFSRTASDRDACTSGDTYRAAVAERDAARVLFKVLSIAVGGRMPSAYWMNTSAALLPGEHVYEVTTLHLMETSARRLQLAEEHGPLTWTATFQSPLIHWLRERRCVSALVPLDSRWRSVSIRAPLPTNEPICGAVPTSATAAYYAVPNASACPSWLCEGNATARLLAPYRPDKRRSRVGFAHLLKPSGCRFRWRDADEVARCLAGRPLLNMGSSSATSLAKGFERISRANASAIDPRKEGSWWFDFGRTKGRGCGLHSGWGCVNDSAVGLSHFAHEGRSATVSTLFFHHPYRYGLLNVINASEQRRVHGGASLLMPSAAAYEKLMCKHELLVFESGAHDFGFTDRHADATLRRVCSGKTPCCEADVLPVLLNQTWRLQPLVAYRARLLELMAMWRRCQAKAPRFRPIFKLSFAPVLSLRCDQTWGYNTQSWNVAVYNEVARDVVESAGFEVFDPFPAGLHAESPNWYDDSQHSDTLSDLVTQMLISQICVPPSGRG